MARPKFAVQHFLICTDVSWEGIPGPGVKRTLEGVSYLYTVPPDVESPEFSELWVYARLFLMNGRSGSRRFWVELARSDRDYETLMTWPLGTVEFRAQTIVYNEAWKLQPVRFPARGTYEFRLMYEAWIDGSRRRVVAASEFIQVETRT